MKNKMKYFMYIVLCSFLFIACDDMEKKYAEKQINIVKVVEYDNCEYLIGYRSMAHKGNCKYCVEREENNCK